MESPSKAKTINKYLGPGYVVLASVGHVRDLPSRNPKGVKSPVPGVDLERNFAPTYEVLAGKTRNIAELKRAAKQADEVWFATDLDREGEAIAWHLAEELGISPARAKRVMFAAITKEEIERAFKNPHPIDMDRVNAQQARRVLDRIVGYQVSPLLWKKVARGLSAGRVQSVAVRLIAEREREIRAFVPDEFWTVTGYFTAEAARAAGLADEWAQWLARRDEKGNPPTAKAGAAWLGERGAFKAELVEVDGVAFDPRLRVDEIIGPMGDLTPDGIAARQRKAAEAFASAESHDLTPLVRRAVELAGLSGVASAVREEGGGRGPARWARRVEGVVVPGTPYRVTGTQVKRTSARAPGPFITSTLQQAAANRMGFSAVRTMRAAQQLYEGVEVPGEGPVGLITYMRTDSTHLSGAALEMARRHIVAVYGGAYLPEKPNFFASSNKAAQEAHEAIRPTNVEYTPARVRGALSPDQHRLYTLIWERFVACQMTPAQWDATAVTIVGGPGERVTFRATGRVLVFDGFYRVLGVPASGEEQTLPKLGDGQGLAPIGIEPRQRFTSAPPRYTEASLIKTLEAEGIGRPSTYASIISVIQDRKYVEQIERRFYATDLGEVVTDKLVEAFPAILDVGYTREMEADLDKVEEEHLDWVDMLHKFYGPFQEQLEHAMENLSHAKAELTPAPEEYRCQKCGGSLVYRFGKNGRFLSCARYPECDYACPVDREGKPRPVRGVDVACPICRGPMFKRTGRFGAFLGCARYGEEQNPCSGILNIDRKGYVVAPTPPPLVTDLACPTCAAPLNLRGGARGPWLGCSRFPKCRGRGKWAELPAEKRAELEAALAAHERSNPVPIIRTLEGRALTDAKGKPLPDAPTVERLSPDGAGDADGQSPGGAEGLLGEVA
ncbi:MAG TPA: DNA topoisomerase [Phycisphaerales bacterium]|nr:DNA topoisomerase [Phycisphaerales bacterium]